MAHVKQYASDHNITYSKALKLAGESYKKVEKVEKVKKEDSGDREYNCEFCKYKSTDKSNFNRHFKKHVNREKLLLDLMEARGLIKTHKMRATTSNNKETRENSKAIYEKALKIEEIALGVLKRLEAGDLKTDNKNTVKSVVKVEKYTSKIPKYIDNIIDRINDSYESSNNIKLGLTKGNITEFKKTKDDIILKINNLDVDDGEMIDTIEIIKDDKLGGYNTTFLQDADIRGKVQTLEYDNMYVY